MEKSMREEWRPVRGKEEWAEISNFGQIHKFKRVIYCGRNHKSKRIQEESWTYGGDNGHGYLQAGIGGVNKGVHVWVYLTFVGDIPQGLEVNHMDENKHNNRLDNLNLLNHGDNMRYGTGNARRAAAHRGRKRPAEVGEKISAAKRGMKLSEEHKAKLSAALSKPVQALNPKTLEVVMEFASTAEAQRQGFSAGNISQCCRNCYKRPGNNVYKGLIWRFAVQ